MTETLATPADIVNFEINMPLEVSASDGGAIIASTVIGYVDQQVTNVTVPKGNQQRYRMVVTLVRTGDDWSVDNVETV